MKRSPSSPPDFVPLESLDGAGVGDAPEGPMPLRRPIPSGEPFPVEALGPLLGGAVRGIADIVQCPPAIAGQSVLSVASLAAQGLVDVVIPATGAARPASLFLVTVAGSGDRKSAADSMALEPVRRREERLRAEYEVKLDDYKDAKTAWDVLRSKAEKPGKGQVATRESLEAALRGLGPEPLPPLLPHLTCPDPTVEGLHKLFAVGQPALGLFNDDGGSFVAGHGMSPEKKLATGAQLSQHWDGSPIKRIRAGEGAVVLYGRRLAVHLMIQPGVAASLLSDQVLADQGLLSRVLCTAR